MRSGRLRHRASLYNVTGDPPALSLLGAVWVGLEPDPASGEEADSLRAKIRTKVPVRHQPWMRPGLILTHDERLWVVESIATRREIGADAELYAYEYLGEAGIYRDAATGTDYPVLVKLRRSVPDFIGGDQSSVVEFAREADFLRFQIPAVPTRGDTLTVAGVTYQVDTLTARSEWLAEGTLMLSTVHA